MSTVFLRASREKFRFPSPKGELTTEQLWDLPLQSKTGCDLDTVARNISRQLKAQTEESFVTTSNNSLAETLQAQLTLVVFIIETKKKEAADAQTASTRRAERAKLLEILHLRTQQDLMTKSPAEIQAMIDSLGN